MLLELDAQPTDARFSCARENGGGAWITPCDGEWRLVIQWDGQETENSLHPTSEAAFGRSREVLNACRLEALRREGAI